MNIHEIVDSLRFEGDISSENFTALLGKISSEECEYLFKNAREVREENYGKAVFLRGLIEFTNYCRNDCLYCGIRKSNRTVSRYRLSKNQILDCADEGYNLGFRTFVLQGGEDLYFKAAEIANIVSDIKKAHPDCAVTLSVGERDYADYKLWFDSGADRYLLRHETASESHYNKLHPETMSLSHRKECLNMLKEIGYQVGAGFMVGSPFQTDENLYEDIVFLRELSPHMIGIGPFMPACGTPFSDKPSGSLEKTLKLLAILRLIFPCVLLPATTALGTITPDGRERGLLAGANVVMPNLSPVSVRDKYKLYDNKISTGEESAQSVKLLENSIKSIGYEVSVSRGDYMSFYK